MPQLGELLNKLAIQSGIDANNEGLKALLSNPTVASYDIPEAIASSIQGNLLTVESAKNNPILKNHFYALALNGLDTELDGLMTELGIDEAVKGELLAEKSSTKRASLLTKKVKELEAAKAQATGGKADKLQEQIDSLNQQILTERSKVTEVETNLKNQHKAEIKDLLLRNMLGQYDYALPVSMDANITTAMALFNSELNTKNGVLELDDNKNMVLKTKDGMKLFDNNQEIGIKDFVDGVLGKHKLLKASGQPPVGTPPVGTPPVGTPPVGTPPVASNAFAQAAAEAAKQFDR